MNKKNISIIFLSLLLTIPVFSQSQNSYAADYEMGNDYFDHHNYNKAINYYLAFWNNYKSNLDKFENSTVIQKDKNGIVKESYFSLYNIACCYSILKQYQDAEYYLKFSVLAGYPYLDHILKDSDLENLFSTKKELKTEIQNIYKKGNSKDILVDKQIHVDNLEGTIYSFFKDSEGNYRFTKQAGSYLDIAKHEIYGEGEFEFQNFKIVLKYDTYKETYQYYDDNQQTEKFSKHDNEYIYWYAIGTDMSVSDYYLKDEWKGSYKKYKDLLIPQNK